MADNPEMYFDNIIYLPRELHKNSAPALVKTLFLENYLSYGQVCTDQRFSC